MVCVRHPGVDRVCFSCPMSCKALQLMVNYAVFFELTVTVTQIANNWKEMNELTVTVTQKI